jgi:hypothetical protein
MENFPQHDIYKRFRQSQEGKVTDRRIRNEMTDSEE